MNFNSKNVVFVGGLGAIGYETCKQLMKKPIATLYILDIIENPNSVQILQAMNTRCKVRCIKFDITNKTSIRDSIKTIISEVKFIDILINGAGIVSEDNYELMLNVNLIGLITTTFEALPYMDKQKHGRGGLIANIASTAGLEPASSAVVYSVTKFGVVGFTRAMADSYYFNLTGVAVTAICPAITESPLKNNFMTLFTFEYGKPLVDPFNEVQCQSAATCAEHFIRIIETNKNGSIWISNVELKEIELQTYWTPAKVETCTLRKING